MPDRNFHFLKALVKRSFTCALKNSNIQKCFSLYKYCSLIITTYWSLNDQNVLQMATIFWNSERKKHWLVSSDAIPNCNIVGRVCLTFHISWNLMQFLHNSKVLTLTNILNGIIEPYESYCKDVPKALGSSLLIPSWFAVMFGGLLNISFMDVCMWFFPRKLGIAYFHTHIYMTG